MTAGFLWQQLKLWVKQGLTGCAQGDDDPKDPRDFAGDFRRRRVYGLLQVRVMSVGTLAPSVVVGLGFIWSIFVGLGRLARYHCAICADVR